MKFKAPISVEPEPAHPLEVALQDADRALEDGRREAREAVSRLEPLEVARREAAASLAAEKSRRRKVEEQKSLEERVAPLREEVAQLDAAIGEAVAWLRDAIERRVRIADTAKRRATRNLCEPVPAGIALPGPLEIRPSPAVGERRGRREVVFEYALGPAPNEVP